MSFTDKISVTIVVKNGGETIEKCLDALRHFNEIIVVDNESTDNTMHIVETFNRRHDNVKVFSTPFTGFGKMKQTAAMNTSNDWVLNIDADEIASPELVTEIDNLKCNIQDIVAFPRKNHIAGRWIKACGWSPDYVFRLYNKTYTNFNDDIVHESIVRHHDTNLVYLKNSADHLTAVDIETFINKMNRYTSFSANQKFRQGKTTTIGGAIVRFMFTFIKDYFFRRGIFYGYHGFLIALMNANGAFYRYLKLYELHYNKKRT